MKLLASVLIFMALGLTSAFAQKTSAFSGNWKFKNQESISGQLYSNGVPSQINISEAKDNLTLEKITASGDGQEITTTEILPVNGKTFETVTSSNRKKLITLKWDKDHAGFTSLANLYQVDDATKVEIKYTDKYHIENDQLVLVRKTENMVNGEVWESKSTYDNQ